VSRDKWTVRGYAVLTESKKMLKLKIFFGEDSDKFYLSLKDIKKLLDGKAEYIKIYQPPIGS